MKDHTLSFKDFFENARDSAILIMDTEGYILQASEGFKRHYGYDQEDLYGKHFSVLFIKEDREKKLPEKELSTVLTEKATTDNNYILHKKGFKIWSHGESILTKSNDGRSFLVKHIYDINHRKQLESILIEKNHKLDKAKRDLETFVYTSSHDLKAPISNLKALFSTLENKLDENSRNNTSEILNMIHQSIEKFHKVLKDLSVTGEKQAEEAETPSSISLSELFEEVKSNMLDTITETRALFIEDIGDVPYIKFPQKNLRSIFYNLISNAIKYRLDDRRPEIRISTKRTDGYVLIEVHDNGVGIEEGDKEKVFDMYSRLHDHVEGTGVGLNIVKRLVENNGGKIELESEVGKGSTFKVYLKEEKE